MKMLFAVLAAWSTLSGISMATADDAYPRGELLVEPATLVMPTVREDLLLDARDKKKYLDGHIPGAVGSITRPGPRVSAMEKTPTVGAHESALGVAADSKVVVYDDTFSRDAARIWWILRYWGVKDVRILNGGWNGWVAGKHPIDKRETAASEATFTATPHPDRFATKAEMLAAIEHGNLQIVDARSEKEFCGVEAMNNKLRGGDARCEAT